ncbi:MAG: hypothetical protein EPO24_06155 [Bacteroidetes bacterium]|nr:MAG: hypothetical protein EPO24_06155 [Bacteroidota bacterium]
MKYFLCFSIFVIIFTGCDKSKIQELEKKNTELQTQVTNATRDLSTQTQYVEEVTQAINAVYANMQRITEGESMLSKSTKELEIGKGALKTELKERIINQIAGIDTYIAQNRKKLTDLEAKLKSYRGKYQGLEKIVETLKQALAEKETAIASLESKLKEMNVQIESLEERLAQKTESEQHKEQVISTQKKEINAAMYIVGNRDELISKGVLDREGGFPFGLFGKTSVLASGFDKDEFITIDRYEQTTIEIAGKIDELVPKRKENYFTITEDVTTTKILILDPDKFWQEEYLVVVTK